MPKFPMPKFPEVTRDEKYYFSSADDLLIFQVENRLFKVHRFFLERESPVFRDMLSLPQTSGDNRKDTAEHEGGSDARPIHIPDVTVAEFRALLDLFYKPPGISPAFSQKEWLTILPIAYRFQVAVNFEYVTERLETSTPRLADIEQVAIIAKYGLPMSYVTPALARLVARKDPLTGKEIERIPPETISLLSKARENLIENLYRQIDKWFIDPTDEDRIAEASKQVQYVFGLKMK